MPQMRCGFCQAFLLFALPIAIWPPESWPEAFSASRASPSLMADIRANPFNYYLYQDFADELAEIGDDHDAALSVQTQLVMIRFWRPEGATSLDSRGLANGSSDLGSPRAEKPH